MVTVNNLFSQLILLFSLSWSVYHVHARIHHLTLKEDTRQYFKVSTFGYLYGGTLRVNVDQFSFSPYDKGSTFGFTLLKTKTDGLHPFAKEKDVCILDQENGINRFDDNIGLVSMTIDLKRKKVIFRCSQLMKQLRIIKGYNNYGSDRRKRAAIEDNKPIAVDPSAQKPPPSAPDPVKGKDTKTILERINEHSDLIPSKPIPTVAQNQPNQNLPEPKSSDGDANINPNDSDNVNSIDNNVKDNGEESNESENYCKDNYEIDLKNKTIDGVIIYSFEFHTFIIDDSLAGLYSLYFHSCPNYRSHTRYENDHKPTSINLSMIIEEKNYDSADNYLSAGEMPLPQLYFTLSIVFCILGLVWIRVIQTRKEDAFKIHYLMGALVFVKALALFFHSIDYHFIAQVGSQNETWAILYYTTHFLKGALLFITIALIGTGWAFVKHILSDKDKKIFMIVIPLQVLANVAEIITEESEEGQFMHNIWRTIFLLVDLICCGAILFPIVWSIRHLQEASQTDGKAAINLLKLKLFRRFYVMIVCYIYFTRIIVFILRLVVPFQFEWLDVFFQHVATLAFFISTGYHFQPTHSNPYFQLSQQEDLEMEEVLFNATPNVYIANTTKKRTKEKDNETSEDKQTLITKRDNSHDFE